MKQRFMIVSLKIEGCPLVFTASYAGNVNLVNYLLDECNANIEQRGTYLGVKSTPLWMAAKRNHFYVVVTLAEHGADINSQASTGKSVVSISCRNAKIARFLVQQGANINLPDFRGRTCLMHCAQHSNICSRLISLGANVNRVDHKGQDALHFAIKRGQLKTVDLFVRHDSNLLRQDNSGMTPLEMAAIHCKQSIMEYLISTDQYGREAIVSAYELLGCQYAMDYHLEYNADQVKACWFKALNLRKEIPGQMQRLVKTLPNYQRAVTAILGDEFTCEDCLKQFLTDENSMWTQALLVQSRIMGPTHPNTIKCFRRKLYYHMNRNEFHYSLQLFYCLLINFEYFHDPLQNDVLDVIGNFSSNLMNTILINNMSTYYIACIFHAFVKYVCSHVLPFMRKYGKIIYYQRIPDFERFLTQIIDLVEFLLNFPMTESQTAEIEQRLSHLIQYHPRGMNQISLIQLAIQMYHPVTVIEMFIKCGADVNAIDAEGNTAIHYAILYPSQSQTEILSCLLRYGCHVDIVNNNGYSPLEYLQKSKLISNSLDYCTLQCLCARIICEYKLSYQHILSKNIAYFVEKHG